MDYIPVTSQEKEKMLKTIGVKDSSEFFLSIPEKIKIKDLDLPKGISELELSRKLGSLSKKNLSLKDTLCFTGAGIYEHFIPSVVNEIVNRSEFSTAYTPYQPEASQGTLQAIFEYQSQICELTGLDVSNASLYDGATAVAEAAILAIRASGKNKLLVSEALNPEYQEVLRTYLQGINVKIVLLPVKEGSTASDSITPDAAAVIVQSPNFFGTIEDVSAIKNKITDNKTLLITVVNPISLGVFKSPAELGASIAVGEGQILGNNTGFGGCTFGFMAAKKELAWKMPGRIVGQTIDTQNRRGFVLTLQSREQHIRRERATSNICTNAALNAFAASVYLAGWGKTGIKQLAEQNIQKAGYAYEQIINIPGFKPAFKNQVFFNEFAIKTDKDIKKLQEKLLNENIIGPLELGRFYKNLSDCLLFCVTETKTKEDIDKLIKLLKT